MKSIKSIALSEPLKDDQSVYSQCIGYLSKIQDQQKILKEKENEIIKLINKVKKNKDDVVKTEKAKDTEN